MNVRVVCASYLLISLVAWSNASGDPLARELLNRLADRDLLSVDRQQHVWAWSRSSSRVEVFTRQGERLAIVRVPQARSLDVESQWGVAALVRDGRELRGFALDGRPLFVLPLEEPMGEVVWIDPHTVAVSPTLSGHRVEIWDVKVGARVRTLGEETPIQSAPGAQFSRSVDLAYDHKEGRLFSVESRTGELEVFSLDGERVGQGQLVNPRLEEFDRWIRGIDRDMKEKGQSHLQALWYFRLSLDHRGRAWAVQSCGEESRAMLVRVAPSGKTTAIEVEASCCSMTSLIAGDDLILHSRPGLPGGPCVHVMKVPGEEESDEVPSS